MPNKSIDLYKEIIDKSNSGVIYAIPMIEADSVLDFEIVVLNQSAKELLQVEGEVKYVGELPICVSKELNLQQFKYIYSNDSVLQRETIFKYKKSEISLNASVYKVLDGIMILFYDITKYKLLEEKLSYSAYHDKLTNLPNRLLFQERLYRSFLQAQRSKQKVVVLFIDLDGFKTVNDTLGHDFGDELLVQAAERLIKCARDTDTVARLGGDEFTVVMENVQQETDATIMAQRIINAMKKPVKLDNKNIFVTASIGIAVGDPEKVSPKLLMKQADMALYLAKEEGKNTFRYYTASLNVAVQKKMYFMNAVHDALKNKEFEVFYQPIADVRSGEIVNTEVLLRWKHPELGYIPTHDFLPVLEETGVICSVGMWVIDQACASLKDLREKGIANEEHKISINLSPAQILKQNVFYQLKEILNDKEISPDSIVFEITEKILMLNNSKVRKILYDLQDFGVKIALDDFGSGFSSINHVKKYPINFIKMDKSFIFDLINSESDRLVAEAIVKLSHTLGIKVVAEGVENKNTLTSLEEINCDFYQGYHLVPPLNYEEYKNFRTK